MTHLESVLLFSLWKHSENKSENVRDKNWGLSRWSKKQQATLIGPES